MKVLIAIDEQACINEVAEFVRRHQFPKDTEFYVVNVIAPIMFDYALASYPVFLESMWQDAQKSGEALVDGMKLRLSGATSGEIKTDVQVGVPAQILTEIARHWHADVAIVGSHGRHGLNKFFMGSVSQDIAAHVPCSVVVLRMAPVKAEVKQPVAADPRLVAAG
jgi:nucleotide-binding universal stress UspA family protein